MAPTIETSLDVLTIILEYVCESAETARSVLSVNKLFHLVAKRLAHRNHVLHFPDFVQSWTNVIQKHPWLEQDNVVPHIQYLTIAGSTNQPPAVLIWARLVTLLQQMRHLKILSYKLNHPPPTELLDGLAQHQPRAKLLLFSYNRGDMTTGSDHPLEKALCRSSALTSISTHIRIDGVDQTIDLREAAIRRIIACAPNLKLVSVSKRSFRCARRSDYPFEELHRREEPFLAGLKPNTSVRHLGLDGFGSTRETLEDWSKVVSLSSLETLKCFGGGHPHPSFFTAASELLPNLKRLNANFAYCDGWPELATAVEHYLTTCAPLEHISLWSWRDFAPLDAILRHGPTLRLLELHEREDNRRDPISVDEIKQIRDRCPNLEDLTVDIRRETRDGRKEIHNPQKYDAIAAIPKLQRLQIYFDLGLAWEMEGQYNDDSESEGNEHEQDEDENERHPLRPTGSVLAKPIMERLWRQIFGTRPSGVRKLDVKYGEFYRGFAPHLWEKENTMQWQVLPNERDDMRSEPVLFLIKVPEPEKPYVKAGRQ